MTSSRARTFESLIVQHIANVGNNTVSVHLGCDASNVSRIKNNEAKIALVDLCTLLDAIGLKVVDQQMRCFRPEDITPYIQLAKQHMNRINRAEDLFDDEE